MDQIDHREARQRAVDTIKGDRHRALRMSLRNVLESEDGRRVMAWVIWELGQLDGRRFVVEPDPVKDGLSAALHDARFDGRRFVADNVASECETSAAHLYDVMDTERRNEARRTHARLRDATGAVE